MNTLIDIVKSDPGYFAMLLVTLIGGFGMGCVITEAIFRWEGDNDEKDVHKGKAVAGKIKDSKSSGTEG